MGVFHADQPRSRRVQIVLADARLELFRLDDPSCRGDEAQLHARDNCRGACLVDDDMVILRDQHLVAAEGVGQDRQLIAEGPRGNEERGLFTQLSRGHLFQAIDRRIIGVNVIADGGGFHRFPHLFCRFGDGVAS